MKLFTAFIASVCLLASAAPAHALGETVSTVMRGQASEATGSALRPQVNELVELVMAKKLIEAERQAGDLKARFEALFDPGKRHRAFLSEAEYLDFKNSATEDFEWVDWGYKECLHIKAFVAAERRDFKSALTLLAAIEQVAPAASSVAAERGYILNQVGKPVEALAAYQVALSLSTRYPSQHMYRALALRGIGFTYIELNKLDEAQEAFMESLKIEPGNMLALSELAHINELRAKK